jgi:PIN domain nuclease of toxin-antitoxin system
VRLLLDTCTFLWWAGSPRSLSPAVRELLGDPGNDAFLSAVSAWEIAVKFGLGQLGLPEPPDRWVPRVREAHGFTALDLDEEAATAVCRLPRLHRDPFDRMLVAQAITRDCTIVTPDPAVRAYPAKTLW